MVNPFDIYARASKHQSLTPAERAFLKTLGGLWQAAVGAGAVAIVQAALQGGQPLTFATLGQIGAVAAATAFIIGVSKLVSAHGDTPLANALDQEAAQLGQQVTPQARSALRYQGQPSGPITQRLPAMGGVFPPTMPDSPTRRRELLQAAGATLTSNPGALGAATRPVTAVSAADGSATTAAQSAQMASEPSGGVQPSPAPSQAVAASSGVPSGALAPQDDALGDGQPTLRMAAVRATAPVGAAATAGPADAWTTS